MENQEVEKVAVANAPVVTGSTEYIDVENTQKEFEQLTGRSTLSKEGEKGPVELDLADPMLQPHVADPAFIVEIRELAEKHGLNWVDLLNDMGLNTERKLAAFMTSRSISEQIYTLSREFARIISKRGSASNPPVNTLELTVILADTPDMVAFKKVLDEIVFPYMSEWERSSDDPEKRTLNANWFAGKEELVPKDTISQTVEFMNEAKQQNMEIIREVEEAKREFEESLTADVDEGLDVEQPKLDELAMTHGDEDVIVGIDEAELVNTVEHLEHEPNMEVDSSIETPAPVEEAATPVENNAASANELIE